MTTAKRHLTLVYGAGVLGKNLVRQLNVSPIQKYFPVGFIDDNPDLVGTEVENLQVLGNFSDVHKVVQKTGATHLILSIADADSRLIANVTESCKLLGVVTIIFPTLEEILEGKTREIDLRDVTIEDLIGRHPVDTRVESMAGYLKGKRVLVTGAGGSIGSELSRQLKNYFPSDLVLLDRDESGLQATELMISNSGLLNDDHLILCDIRDVNALEDIFEKWKPEVVFHAAALKHLPLLERFPNEAWATNVIGTLNVLEAAEKNGCQTFVNISTDKAANPTSILGKSKRIAEQLTAEKARTTNLQYLSVRFGNVLGSRGSMVPLFASMIRDGGPITLTHPEVSRYFMTIPEACHLVIQAGGIGNAGEVLILDMGEPVKILDIAKKMIEMSGKPVEIIVTGLRPGEKLHEELIGEGEVAISPVNPKISHSKVEPINLRDLDQVRSQFH
ncbi:FlaA1/EpsC-like NDP-sugar epimerase [Aurantimicrobium minutum]|uniref:nucleoside-diphosphate sugar epimerase/dehydratase n=1 Tax=Aurantimicrobium minutum TaxID=708131 RepID=UPI0024767E77|nr:nucleoside-diphosphate sugar epimerase/dehydratase [Aurantimicrobium minutum]MDH6425093.1 FlaA1/EpsC-like NDP-sugar epimerase [Aurantimicrobium minutum]